MNEICENDGKVHFKNFAILNNDVLCVHQSTVLSSNILGVTLKQQRNYFYLISKQDELQYILIYINNYEFQMLF